jgi:Zn-dependent M28 family amino/carboxypeptidase
MGSPGADDNASGLAALLECARLGSRREMDFTICFAAVDLEEYGMHGSRHLAARLKQEGIDVRAMLSLEMVGYTDPKPGAQKYPVVLRPFYPSTGDFIALVANWKSRNLLRNVATVFRQVPELPVQTLAVPGNGWLLPVSRLSDHAPFWDRGFPALLVTDTAFLRNPNYHRPTDTIETIDVSFLGRVTEALSRVTSMKG